MRPKFRVTANSNDITQQIEQRLLSLHVTDEAGLTSDVLELQLADHDDAAPLTLPPTGAELRVALGYEETGLAEMGTFVVEGFRLEGWPGRLTVRAKAAVFDTTPGGATSLASHKTRSWPADTTLGALVAKIAAEHKLTPRVAPAVASIKLPHLDQRYESDMHLLTRLSRSYDLVFKPADGALVVAKRGAATSFSGAPLAAVEVLKKDLSSWSFDTSKRDQPGTVVCQFSTKGTKGLQFVEVGKGEPVKRIRHPHSSREQALAEAQAELSRRQRGERTLQLTLPGRVDITAECRVSVPDLHPALNGEWLAVRVEHSLGPDVGFRTVVDLQSPEDVVASRQAAAEGAE